MHGRGQPARPLRLEPEADRHAARAAAGRRADALPLRPALDRKLPKRWGPFTIQPGNVELAVVLRADGGLADAAPISAPMTLDAWRAAARRRERSVVRVAAAPRCSSRAPRSGATAPRWPASTPPPRSGTSPHGDATSVLGDPRNRLPVGRRAAGRRLARRRPTTPPTPTSRDTDVETLLISGELDGATPAAARDHATCCRTSNGHQVILRGFGHTTDFWTQQKAAGNHLVNTYLETGRVDDSRYPPQTSTSRRRRGSTDARPEARAARWSRSRCSPCCRCCSLRSRVRPRAPRRGRASSCAPCGRLVLGLGGWLGAALLALIAFPTVPLDAAPLVVPSVGLPVALGAYLGLARTDRPKRAGLAGAVAGALLGAWLGFALRGRAAGAADRGRRRRRRRQPALIACDIVSDRAHSRRTPSPAHPHLG